MALNFLGFRIPWGTCHIGRSLCPPLRVWPRWSEVGLKRLGFKHPGNSYAWPPSNKAPSAYQGSPKSMCPLACANAYHGGPWRRWEMGGGVEGREIKGLIHSRQEEAGELNSNQTWAQDSASTDSSKESLSLWHLWQGKALPLRKKTHRALQFLPTLCLGSTTLKHHLRQMLSCKILKDFPILYICFHMNINWRC